MDRIMKKILLYAVSTLVLASLMLSGCSEKNSGTTEKPETVITEEMLMQNNTVEHKCISLKDELGITYDIGTEPNEVTHAYTWVVNELVLNSTAEYKKPFDDVTLDMKLSNGEKTYTVPGFWDGKSVWRVRFVCPTAGEWTYETVCSNTSDPGLHGIKGTVTCEQYRGELDIYKHGFVKTVPNTKYFMFDDGTPFFYLGDTHWSMGSEPIDNFATVVKKRAEQGFTVMQSEPLGASFDLSDGLSTADISGLKKFDKYFIEIADKGMLHTNASLFFPSAMESFIKKFGGYTSVKVGTAICKDPPAAEDMYDLSDGVKEELEKLTRYWTARYGAYPVMWTLGQEVDDDFYWKPTSHKEWSYVNNPFVYIADCFGKYDAYAHPLSAHQEGMNTTAASNSAFRECSTHTWYAAQWKWLHFDRNIDYTPLKDFWENGQGKPMVDYEGYYCYLWTKNFGARAQGWMAFLCGGCGYGWGGQDTWCYKSTYDEDQDCNYDCVDVVTADDKKNATWQDALEFESTYQMTYMRDFLEHTVGDWQKFIPRFDDTAYFKPENNNVLYCMASTEDSSRALLYFYNFSDASLAEKPNASEADAKKTGTVASLMTNTDYVYVWFDPVHGTKLSSGSFKTDKSGTFTVGEKITSDAVLYICKSK